MNEGGEGGSARNLPERVMAATGASSYGHSEEVRPREFRFRASSRTLAFAALVPAWRKIRPGIFDNASDVT